MWPPNKKLCNDTSLVVERKIPPLPSPVLTLCSSSIFTQSQQQMWWLFSLRHYISYSSTQWWHWPELAENPKFLRLFPFCLLIKMPIVWNKFPALNLWLSYLEFNDLLVWPTELWETLLFSSFRKDIIKDEDEEGGQWSSVNRSLERLEAEVTHRGQSQCGGGGNLGCQFSVSIDSHCCQQLTLFWPDLWTLPLCSLTLMNSNLVPSF